MGKFGDEIRSWTVEAQDDLLAVFQRAVVLLAAEMTRTKANGGNLPHVTGNLMRSILARIGSMPPVGDAGARFAGGDVGAVVAQAMLEDEVNLGFQAAYAARMNYGFVGEDALGRTYNQEGNLFIERAVGLWPKIVDQAISEVRKAGGNG